MRARIPLRFLSGLAFVGATLTAGSTKPAGPAPSASAATKPRREPPPEPLETQEIPTAPSPRPTLDEWKTATRIEVTRRGRDTRPCQAYRVREWLKVKCQISLNGIRQYGGSPKDVLLWVTPRTEYGWWHKNGGELILPMRPGDRRVLQFYTAIPEMCFGSQTWPSVIVDETWIEGERGPTVVLR